MQKLKAGLSAVIDNDKKVIQKSRQIYWRNALIDAEDKPAINNDFLKFLNNDS